MGYQRKPVTRLRPRKQDGGSSANGMESAADNAHLAAKFFLETVTSFLVTHRSRFVYPAVSAGNNLQWIQKIIDVRRKERSKEFPTNSINGAIASNDGTEI